MSDPAVLSALREFYSTADGWLVLGEVRSGTGYQGEIRYADAVAVNLWPSAQVRLIGFEFKVAASARNARADLRRELQQPQKMQAVGRFCAEWHLVVRAPWKRTLFDLDELPPGVGLVEVGTGKPVVVRRSERREPEPMTEAFMLSLLRSAAGQAEEKTAPMRGVASVSRETLRLSCGHEVPRAMFKKPPPKIQCFACGDG